MKQKLMQRSQGMADQMQNAGETKNLLPEKYAVPEGSGLTATITQDASKNVFDFALVP